MFTLAFLVARHEMRRRLIGARGDDPVLPEPSAREQRGGQPVDRRRPAQRGAHVARVAPQAARGDEHVC